MTASRMQLYTTDAVLSLAAERSGDNRSAWINSTVVRYAAIQDEVKPGLARLFTNEQVRDIVAATSNRVLDHTNVARYIIEYTRDMYLAEWMRNLSVTQRCVLCDCCEQYVRRTLAGEPTTPTVEELFR